MRSVWLFGEAYKKAHGDKDTRTDLAHEVVIRLADNALRGKCFSPEDNFAAYWRTVIARELVNTYRQTATHSRAENVEHAETAFQVKDDPAAPLEARERVVRIKKMAAKIKARASKLSARQRQWLELVKTVKSPADANQQLAQTNGVSVRTLQRDADWLREHFQDLRWEW